MLRKSVPQIAEDFILKVNKSKQWKNVVVTSLEPFTKYYLAEDYHQNYLEKNPDGYTCHGVQKDSFLD